MAGLAAAIKSFPVREEAFVITKINDKIAIRRPLFGTLRFRMARSPNMVAYKTITRGRSVA
jgi:hypothetical protein